MSPLLTDGKTLLINISIIALIVALRGFMVAPKSRLRLENNMDRITPIRLIREFDLTESVDPEDIINKGITLWKGSVPLFPEELPSIIEYNGALWVSWPKKLSRMNTDLNENIIREIGLENGLVDVKVISINNVWSGLKFVYRRRDRL